MHPWTTRTWGQELVAQGAFRSEREGALIELGQIGPSRIVRHWQWPAAHRWVISVISLRFVTCSASNSRMYVTPC